MKTLTTIALVGALVSTPLAAEEIKEPSCNAQASVAEAIMKSRQVGVPLVNVLRVIGEDKYAQKMAIRAYKRPQYPEGYRTKPITDFQNDIYLECLESMD